MLKKIGVEVKLFSFNFNLNERRLPHIPAQNLVQFIKFAILLS